MVDLCDRQIIYDRCGVTDLRNLNASMIADLLKDPQNIDPESLKALASLLPQIIGLLREVITNVKAEYSTILETSDNYTNVCIVDQNKKLDFLYKMLDDVSLSFEEKEKILSLIGEALHKKEELFDKNIAIKHRDFEMRLNLAIWIVINFGYAMLLIYYTKEKRLPFPSSISSFFNNVNSKYFANKS